MKDFNLFIEGMKNLKQTYPSWQVNTNDASVVSVWFAWFLENTKLSDAGFTEMINEYKRSRIYPPLSPRDLFDAEVELVKREHTDASIIWREATEAFKRFQKQDEAYKRWISVTCGKDSYAMEFLMSKEFLSLLQLWLADENEYYEASHKQSAIKAWNDFVARKLSKTPSQVENRIGFEADDVLKKLE